MDLERIKQINSMIPALQKQGFATNSIEAASQSDAIFKDNDEESFMTASAPSESTVGPKVEEAASQEAVEAVASTPTIVSASPEALAKIAELEERVASVENDLNTIIGKMNEMIEVITRLEQGVQSGSGPKEKQQTSISRDCGTAKRLI